MISFSNMIILIVMTFLGAFAGFALKKASAARSLLNILVQPFFYIGGFLYLASAILNVYLLRFIDFSVMLPLTSITYVWTMIIAHSLLSEKITNKKIIGTLFIITGVFILVVLK